MQSSLLKRLIRRLGFQLKENLIFKAGQRIINSSIASFVAKIILQSFLEYNGLKIAATKTKQNKKNNFC